MNTRQWYLLDQETPDVRTVIWQKRMISQRDVLVLASFVTFIPLWGVRISYCSGSSSSSFSSPSSARYIAQGGLLNPDPPALPPSCWDYREAPEILSRSWLSVAAFWTCSPGGCDWRSDHERVPWVTSHVTMGRLPKSLQGCQLELWELWPLSCVVWA